MTLQNTLRDLIYKVFNQNNLSDEEIRSIFEILIKCECDFFELANEVARITIPIPFHQIEAVFALCPNSTKIKDVKLQTIHALIPRWTSTKYHSGTIAQVTQDIQEKIISRDQGLYAYHSNLSPRRSSVDDPYLLLINSQSAHFFDINRRKVYLYEYACEEGSHDSLSGV